ncbi:NAD(P)-dependent oxidoreductase [Candidatus Bathycorpusculum sp.]|uniref:NAD(P)-dependent oxidoreductase n=1 Tax=Candidatus Bathycorpusculum sp. TaxID=2994959 RepID=UPI00281B46DE|nr:NAD(P)-dependent oxidoreductase [Candidatus Termitimicrobium sp.]MCL2685603.1 NAD(P)-dependent oxidoreductase [Candidatus Termitimicrobium sp.]
MRKYIIDDAKRCLQCKNPLCSKGCPIHTPIKEAIALLLESKLLDAGKLLFENNPLSLVCSHVCPQEDQCEGHCIMGKKGTPVFISAIEQYISDYYLYNYKPVCSLRNRGKVAILGSGPAGITIAFLLAKKNYDVTIFEKHDQVGGILRYGIPEFRLPKRIVDQLMATLIQSGIKIRPNTTIGSNLTVDDLFRDGFLAIFMGTGVWQPRKLNIKGESLGHVHFAIEYLKNPSVYRLGKSLIIIGAGNVAMDAARTALRHGCEEVLIVYHKDKSGITATEHELQYAKIDGARLELNKLATEITDEGVVFADSEIYLDETGHKQARAIPGTEKLYSADSVIIAISQGPRTVVASSTTGINLGQNGLVVVDGLGHTSREGVFAGGDVVTGARTVVEAVVASRKIAETIDEYIVKKQAHPDKL